MILQSTQTCVCVHCMGFPSGYVSVHRSAGGEQSIDVSSLPGMDVLNQPGAYYHTKAWFTIFCLHRVAT